ncbi:hypothetical protein H4S06_006183 [Coemansia sp. BCRC 34490]|nr:hypothetical protein H4S06_006183 [Coemansia sp. BCRC 34490]
MQAYSQGGQPPNNSRYSSYVDGNTGRTYYVDNATGMSQWELPQGGNGTQYSQSMGPPNGSYGGPRPSGMGQPQPQQGYGGGGGGGDPRGSQSSFAQQQQGYGYGQNGGAPYQGGRGGFQQGPPQPMGYGGYPQGGGGYAQYPQGYGYAPQQQPPPQGYGYAQQPPPQYQYGGYQGPPPAVVMVGQQAPPQKKSGSMMKTMLMGAAGGGLAAWGINEYMDHEDEKVQDAYNEGHADGMEEAQDIDDGGGDFDF